MPRPKPKKMGNPNNQTVRAFRGVSAETLRAKQLLANAPAGQADRVVSYDPVAVRTAIEAQTCPFCGRGPYKVLAVHTNKIHGVDRRDLRELAGLNGSARICAPEFSENARQRAHERGFGVTGRSISGSNKGKKYRVTTAGSAAIADNLRQYNMSLSVGESQDQKRRAGAARAAQLLARDACGREHAYAPETTRTSAHEDGREYRTCLICEKGQSRLRHGFDSSNELVDGLGTFRRMQALACIGHSIPVQAKRLGMSTAWGNEVVRQMRAGARVLRSTADAVAVLYDELCGSPAVMTKATRTARTKALRRGWLPPEAWTLNTIDTSEAAA
jgi:hypothetical protein